MHIWKTFLAGTFLAAAGLNVLTAALGIKATIAVSSLLPAVSAGDLIETIGAVAFGILTSWWVRRRAIRAAAA